MIYKEDEKIPYYKSEGLSKFACVIRFKCPWCGKKIVSDGSDNGYKCTDQGCESNNKIPLSKTEQKEVRKTLFFICSSIGLLFLILLFRKLKQIEDKNKIRKN